MESTVTKKDVGRVVISAGWIDLDLERQNVGFNNGRLRQLPPGYRMTLKAIEDDFAFTYRTDQGVMRIPYNLLEPWE